MFFFNSPHKAQAGNLLRCSARTFGHWLDRAAPKVFSDSLFSYLFRTPIKNSSIFLIIFYKSGYYRIIVFYQALRNFAFLKITFLNKETFISKFLNHGYMIIVW